ncbi:hypothetical protein FD724_14170 [Nostoc sp. C057]|uniref:hypothetical protein n=1 Tax=Nostoc sp. C057 TaxID=2576903 RepID=UPI0015C3336D|nr:hypothetical protein [Nostoc sp. C057]QLE49135.1 hypothetical protein FD724_14170 [Nostoc sp. C057]
MDIAKSMRLGGKIIHANECNFSSYDDLKLRCYVCGEPVRPGQTHLKYKNPLIARVLAFFNLAYFFIKILAQQGFQKSRAFALPVRLKKGEYRKPHFAHFRGTDPKQVEQCELRASSYGNKTEISSFIQDRGQRLEIFQQHFISMISVGEEKIVEDVEFHNWIDSIKRDNNQAINKVSKDCIEYFLTHQTEMEISCVYLTEDQPLLQQQIALEAIDYLCVKSSLQLLQYLVHYSMYKLYEHKQYKLFKQKITTKHIANICQYTAKLIMLTPWIEVINNTKNTQLLTINTSQLLESKLVSVIKRNWYALFVGYGKEQSVVKTIVEQLKINAVPDFKHNVDSGLIPSTFLLSNAILDIAYPHEFDMGDNVIVENNKSYLFIEIDDLGKNLFYNIIEPFFKSINDVIGFVGLQLRSPVRLKQQYSKQGRSILRFYNDKITVPVNMTSGDYERLHRSNSSVSVFEKSDYAAGEPVWLVTSAKHKAKYWVVKALDHDMYQIRTKKGFKFPASATMLRKFDG